MGEGKWERERDRGKCTERKKGVEQSAINRVKREKDGESTFHAVLLHSQSPHLSLSFPTPLSLSLSLSLSPSDTHPIINVMTEVACEEYRRRQV